MRITTNNGTTISGSLSEVLATLSHLGVKASDVKPVTSTEVTETAVTTPFEVVEAELGKIYEGVAVTPKAKPKLTRDGVIQQAIDDVKDLLSRNHSYHVEDGKESNRIAAHIGRNLWLSSEGGKYVVCHGVDFVVNADKRTVVAIVAYKNSREEISKGRAKCAPGDVFNEHIGKAIALRRALGLAVPVEYFEVEARDSDDLAVGDVVKGNKNGRQYELIAERDNPAPWQHAGVAFNTNTHEWLASSQVTLINDSARHTAPELEVSRIIRH
jgi:hypothetical protein